MEISILTPQETVTVSCSLTPDVPGQQEIIQSGEFGSLSYSGISGGFAHTWFRSYIIRQPAEIISHDATPMLSLYVNIGMPIELLPSNMSSLKMNSGEFNLLFLPEPEIRSKLPENRYHVLDIHFQPDHLKDLRELSPALEAFVEKVERHEPCTLSPFNCRATLHALHLINEIRDCRFAGDIKIMYIEVKAIELLILCLQSCDNENKVHHLSFLKPYHIERLHVARLFLQQHIDQPILLSDVAHASGINLYVLKRGFKQLFGTTPHEFLIDQRMQKAEHLLKENKLSISDIAYLVGYSSISNFSSAFRKKYGYSPTVVKKTLLQKAPDEII
jgi:AraC-like DNA-binding protein